MSNSKPITKKRSGRFFRILATLLMFPFVLLFTLIILLYIPPIQRYAVDRLCRAVSENTDFDLSVGAFHLSFPLKINIEDFTLSQNGNTILDGEQIGVNIRAAALLKGELEINYISIDNTRIESGGLINGVDIDGEIGHFRTTVRSVDPFAQSAAVRHLHLAETSLSIALHDTNKAEEDSVTQPTAWSFSLNKGTLHNVDISLTMPHDTMSASARIGRLTLRKTKASPGEGRYSLQRLGIRNSTVEYHRGTASDSVAPLNHLCFNDINIETGLLNYSAPLFDAEIKRMAIAQKGGMRITNGKLTATADSTGMWLKRLDIRTENGSSVSGTATVPLSDTGVIGNGEISGSMSVHIDKRDLIRLLTPNEYNSLNTLPDSMLSAEMRLHGSMRTLHIDTLRANVTGLSQIGMRGTIHNLHDLKKIDAGIEFNGMLTDIGRITASGTAPDSLGRQRIQIEGKASLLQDDCSLAIRMNTDGGRIALRGEYNIAQKSYSARMRAKRINLQRIVPQIPLRELTMRLSADGEGFEPFSPLTRYQCRLQIDTICSDSLMLEDIVITAKQAEGVSDIALESNSPTLQMSLNATTRLDTAEIRTRIAMNLENADLQRLGMTDGMLTAGMALEIDAHTDMQQTHGVNIAGDRFRLTTARRTFTPSRLELNGMTSPDTSFVNISTGDMELHGTLASGYEAVMRSLEQISQQANRGTGYATVPRLIQDLGRELPAVSLDFECGQNNILANYMRFKQIEFDRVNLRLSLDSVKGIDSQGGIYSLKSSDMRLDTIRFFVRQNDKNIRYLAGVRTSTLDPRQKKLTFNAALFGTLSDDTVKSNFVFRDSRERIGARIGLNSVIHPDRTVLRFNPEAILFNKAYRFNRDNYISIGTGNNSALRGNVEMLDTLGSGIRLFTSSDTTMLRDVSLELLGIDLNNATRLIPFAPDISGTLNAEVHYRDNKGSTIISSDIHGTDIVYEGIPVGNETLELAYFPKGSDMHYIDLNLLHNDERVFNMNGDFYNDSIQPHIDGEAMLAHFPLNISDAFIKESGLQLDGFIDGELDVNGTIEDFAANGYIRFDSVSAEAASFGTRLRLNDGKVNITDNKLRFDNFDIYGAGNTPFQVSGTVDLKNLGNPEFNLRMRANNYELFNTKRDKQSMLYGRMVMNVNSNVRGFLNAMTIQGQATLLGKSDFTYVMQETPLATENELDGLVQFVNFADTVQVYRAEDEEVDFGNLTMNMALNIEEGARINADFDENRNSYIELQGEGSLNLSYSSETGMTLTGGYTLSDGQLKYTLPIIPLKTFNISEGSKVNWTGDIMNPSLDITATERMMSSVSFEDGSSQAVAFDVGVKLTNTLDNMGLSFVLSAPENATVQNELSALDTETMNKYAVTMLITGAYIGGNGGLTVSNALSSFIDSKINDIAGTAMKSIDINVGITDVENSETGGTYKNYSFSFAKRFWNDRLTIIIGGEVNSGDTAGKEDSFINNVSLEWKLSESGNRYIRLFYDKNYESVLEGEIIETGIGYMYRRKLSNLKELFLFGNKKRREELIIRTKENETTENSNKEKQKK